MRRRVKKWAFYIVDFGGTEMSESGYNQKKMDIKTFDVWPVEFLLPAELGPPDDVIRPV